MKLPVSFALIVCTCFFSDAAASVLYVDLNSSTPSSPYADWSSAATNIQDAVDAAADGDLILVTNGVYRTGGRAVYGSGFTGFSTNRVVVNKAITLASVNGPEYTFIEGYQVPGSITGDAAVRCVYLTNNAYLTGFTLTNGATLASFIGQGQVPRAQLTSGGGAWCEGTSVVISNCVLVGNAADFSFGGMGGGTFSGTLNHCVLRDNRALLGGGASGSILNHCTLSNNMVLVVNDGSAVTSFGGGTHNSTLTNCFIFRNFASVMGGGAASSTLVNCILATNSAGSHGGGVYSSTVIDSRLLGNNAGGVGGGSHSSSLTKSSLANNLATFGGGAYLGTLHNCRLTGNLALNQGGGAHSALLNGCAIINNSAFENGGGAYAGALIHCIVAGNTAYSGGGIAAATATNSIVYFNSATTDTNHLSSTLTYCCTRPLPPGGTANIDIDPELADLFHLTQNSPCRGAGDPAAMSGVDIDGESWTSPPPIGCDEFDSASITGLLTVSIQSDFAHAKTLAVLNLTALIDGHAGASVWDFGDGTTATNQPYVTHAWTSAGNYPVILTAFNDTYPGGVRATNYILVVDQPAQYVALNSTNPVAPFVTWATAATNIQDAVDVAFAGTVIYVHDGIYRSGGRTVGSLSNRVAITKPITVQSVNGPNVTLIEGYRVPGSGSAVRCAYVASGAKLTGFTLTNGATLGGGSPLDSSGGGALCRSNSILSNCVIVSNSCSTWGAGVFGGMLVSCVLKSNINLNGSLAGGGGAAFSTLIDCTIIGNRTSPFGNGGGGAIYCNLSNCLVTGNFDVGVGNSTLNYCVVTGNDGTGIIGSVANHCIISSNTSRTPVSGSFPTYGGGAYTSRLAYCWIYQNRANNGGGAYNSALTNCHIFDNIASANGGGTYQGTNISCIISNNWANNGGGLYLSLKAFNCIISGNRATNSGGGAQSVSLQSCVVSNNSAVNGGGASSSWLTNCLVIGNRANAGGGVHLSVLNNCTVTGNFATNNSGGMFGNLASPSIQNSIIYFNIAPASSNFNGGHFDNCCTIPLPGLSAATITNVPRFIDAAAGNFRLQTNSLCINTGANIYLNTGTDLDGRPRTVGGIVDMGAYEFQGPGTGLFIPWLQQYGLPTDGSADGVDSDLDGLNNWQEWISGTIPIDAQSLLKLLTPVNSPSGLELSWQSVNGKVYFLERASAFGAFSGLQSNIMGQAGITTLIDTDATNANRFFYRVGIQPVP